MSEAGPWNGHFKKPWGTEEQPQLGNHAQEGHAESGGRRLRHKTSPTAAAQPALPPEHAAARDTAEDTDFDTVLLAAFDECAAATAAFWAAEEAAH